MSTEFERNLDAFAKLIIEGGLNLQPGQKLLIRAPIEAVQLVRRVTAHAYQAGASLVSAVWNDEQMALLRFQHAPRDSFTEIMQWPVQAGLEIVEGGGAILTIRAQDPGLLAGQDQELVSLAQQTASKTYEPLLAHIAEPAINWNIVAHPGPGWAQKVYPDLSPEEGMAALWNDIFTLSRVPGEDPAGRWKVHMGQLASIRERLNEKAYDALHLKGEGTDLRIGLPAGHLWHTGELTATNGITFSANIPTEEVFTMPHKDRVDGIVTASKPLSVAGTIIDGFHMRFENGKVVEYAAEQGLEMLRSLLETDDTAVGLGEVALVPYSSPISQSGQLFYNTLFDENAASHIALGRAYRFTMKGGEAMSAEAFAAAGGNESLIHIDFMIGTADMDVDGIMADGTVEPIMRAGEWAIE